MLYTTPHSDLDFDVIHANQAFSSMADFTMFKEANHEIRALSLILNALESSKVICFDPPIRRNRPEQAKPLQLVSNVLVRKIYDNVAIGALVKGDKYCSIALDGDVFQLCGLVNPQGEDKMKT